jgi:hypothetical protein
MTYTITKYIIKTLLLHSHQNYTLPSRFHSCNRLTSISVLFSTAFSILSNLLLLYRFREDTMCYRKGNYIYKNEHHNCTLLKAICFSSHIVCINAVGFTLSVLMITTILTVLFLKQFYFVLYQHINLVVAFLLPYILQNICSKLFNKCAMLRWYHKHRAYAYY